MKLLVIEDEQKTASFLKRGFSEAGFVVDVAPDGPEAMRLIQAGPYDLMVLDLMLPGVDGLRVLTWMRASEVRSPVLILTAKDAVEDRVTGLELGADDYLVKPFAFSELLARVRSILRRPPLREPTVLRVGDLELDLGAYRASRGGQRLDLTTREFVLLTRTMIAQAVWDVNFPTETNVVDVSVRRLRGKVDDPFPQKLLRTVRGVGYVLESAD
jgi:two-component system copper resistance phosphate regulon response regulator CusR